MAKFWIMEMDKKILWTVELNLNGDPGSSASWHIDTLANTCKNNFLQAVKKTNSEHWIILGVAENVKDAEEKSFVFQERIIKQRRLNSLESFLLEKESEGTDQHQ